MVVERAVPVGAEVMAGIDFNVDYLTAELFFGRIVGSGSFFGRLIWGAGSGRRLGCCIGMCMSLLRSLRSGCGRHRWRIIASRWYRLKAALSGGCLRSGVLGLWRGIGRRQR